MIHLYLVTGTSDPKVLLFERFKKTWNEIKDHGIKPGIKDPQISMHISTTLYHLILSNFEQELKKTICRDDYKEFLEIITLFLGGNVSNSNNLQRPGATHHARWMGKAIYALKIYNYVP